jgi:hypothetical protein
VLWLTSSACGAADVANCAIAAGGHVILASDAVDPDVFIWDSRDRLVDFSAGHWGSSRTIFEHTVLAKPGTRAVVDACSPAFAHPHYSARQDAVRVKVLSGPFRGHFGWVLSSDLRGDTAERNVVGEGANHR